MLRRVSLSLQDGEGWLRIVRERFFWIRACVQEPGMRRQNGYMWAVANRDLRDFFSASWPSYIVTAFHEDWRGLRMTAENRFPPAMRNVGDPAEMSPLENENAAPMVEIRQPLQYGEALEHRDAKSIAEMREERLEPE
jgi:hypothetical protein